MPIFEFVCADCGRPFEELVFGSKIDEVTCPTCQSHNITKKISTFASRQPGGSSYSIGSSFGGTSCSTGSV